MSCVLLNGQRKLRETQAKLGSGYICWLGVAAKRRKKTGEDDPSDCLCEGLGLKPCISIAPPPPLSISAVRTNGIKKVGMVFEDLSLSR